MTLTLNFVDKTQVEDLKLYFNEITDYIDIDREHFPGSVQIVDDTITIYMTDDFFRFFYQFFMNILVLNISDPNNPGLAKVKETIEAFRYEADQYLMKPIT